MKFLPDQMSQCPPADSVGPAPTESTAASSDGSAESREGTPREDHGPVIERFASVKRLTRNDESEWHSLYSMVCTHASL